MRRLLASGIALALSLLARDPSQEISTTHTERFSVTAPGSIQLENSFGQVDIEGWDQPDVEVTVVRSSEHLYGEKDRAEAQRRLDSVQITAKQNGNDVVISTAYPPRNGFVHPLSRRSDIEIGYRIRAPRASKLMVDHNRGGVSAFDISGDIHATVVNGQITLTLPSGGRYSIDAQSKIGAVYSDFEGRDRRRKVLGEAFAGPATAPAANLFLRVRIGDIVIAKLPVPPAD